MTLLESNVTEEDTVRQYYIREAIHEYNRQYFAARVAEKQRFAEADKVLSGQ